MSTFYKQKSQKCKKDTDELTIFALLGSALVKAVRKHVGEIATPSTTDLGDNPIKEHRLKNVLTVQPFNLD